MSAQSIADIVLASERFGETLEAIAVRSLLDDLATIVPELPPGRIDWNHAVVAASALVASESEAAMDAALRVAQACLVDTDVNEAHQRAAAVLLERMGNQRTVGLAERRQLLEPDAWSAAPTPLRLDVIRRRLELSIPLANGDRIAVNPFQRTFWSHAERQRWLSVSAPTSAGKSYIVKRWFEERAQLTETFTGVYVVPTRALIDEVSRDLREHFGADVGVYVIPWDQEIGSHGKEVHVLTQERLHLLQERDSTFAPDLLFVDEAQKLGDDARGVLLQRVLDESVRRRPETQVVFASPSSSNPGLLLQGAPRGAPADAVISEAITVSQNLLWVNPSTGDSRRWNVDLVVEGRDRRVGHVELAGRPTSAGKRLPLVAVAVGGEATGNLVYVNGAADAEKTAMQISDVLASRVDLADDVEIAALQDLVARTVHREYRLGPVLRRGVGFHYGNMPLVIRTEIERLFREEKLRYLVCTSTLLEGVNLPCRNLFARGPKRGGNRPMTPADFWNLAGRAGRWGTEFAGNIVCVDTSPVVWDVVPRRRVRQQLARASDHALGQLGTLRAFIASPAPAEAAREEPLLASVFSFLATRVVQGTPLSSIPGVTLSAAECADLESRIREALAPVELPIQTVARHAGVSPTAMQVLLDYFRGHQRPHTLPLALPESDGSELSYTKALSRARDYLGAPFGSDKRCAMLGILVRDWMRGHPLARLISAREAVLRKRGDNIDIPRIIRDTMDDVEEVARFSAPKYLACYLDVLGFAQRERGEAPAIATDDLTMMLELGVSRPTEVSLMSLGLSRTSAIALSALITADALSREESLRWLVEAPIDQLAVPVLVQREVRELLERIAAR